MRFVIQFILRNGPILTKWRSFGLRSLGWERHRVYSLLPCELGENRMPAYQLPCIPAEFVALAQRWYDGSGSMLYAIASTGGFKLGSLRRGAKVNGQTTIFVALNK